MKGGKMEYITTNIRLPKKTWKRFKQKALNANKSLSAWIISCVGKAEELEAPKSGIDKEFADWTDKFIKKYKSMLDKLAKK
jgi:hypothetical protein